MNQQCRLLPLPVSRPAGAQQRRRGHPLTCLSPLTCWRVLTDGKWFRGETLIRLLSNSDWSVLTGVLVPLQACPPVTGVTKYIYSSTDLRFVCSFTSFCARIHLRFTQNIWRVYHQLVELQWRSRSESAGDVRVKRNIRVKHPAAAWTHLETEQVRDVSNLNKITTSTQTQDRHTTFNLTNIKCLHEESLTEMCWVSSYPEVSWTGQVLLEDQN